jgi:sugar lactone lactonase YvrE
MAVVVSVGFAGVAFGGVPFAGGAAMVIGSQEAADTPATLNAEAIKAYRAKDYARFLALEKRALELAPGTPRFIYNVACGEALQGNAGEAVRLLDQLLTRKLDLGAETDDDFSGIRSTPEWSGFQSRLKELDKPVVHSDVAFTLAEPGLIATGIAIDPANGDTYITSVKQRKIVRRTRRGAVSDFISKGQDGFLAGSWLAIDSRRRLLFASCAAPPFMAGYRKEDAGQSGVFVWDLKSGKLVRKAMLPADGKQHFLNALVVDRQGNAYVSDSAVSGIYRMPRDAQALEVFVPGKVFQSTQGLSFSDDEKTLYVADYSDGLWAVDMATRERRRLAEPAGVWLGGLDGLTRMPDGFISVQIGVKPQRVVRLRLDKEGRRITSVEVLEMNHPSYSGPIQGVVSGDSFLYVANSQLDLVNGQNGTFPEDRARPTTVLRLQL